MSKAIYNEQIVVSCLLVHDENGYYHLIYRTTNKKNGKIYVGKHSTKNPYDSYFGSGIKITRAIEKYKLENFTKEIIYCFTDEKEAYLKEAEIVNREFVNRDDTYNIIVGGNNIGGTWSGENHPLYGKHRSQKTKDKLSKAHKGKFVGEKNPFYGKKHKQETKDKISKANKGKYVGEKSSRYGKKHKQETIDKMSKAHKGKIDGEKNPMYGRRGKNNPNSKSILKLDEFGDVITEYGCVYECCAQEHIDGKKLRKLIKEHILYNGFYFVFKNEK